MAEYVSTILLTCAYIAISSMAGLWIASRLPWRSDMLQTRLPRAFGMLLAPFMVGLISVALLALPVEKTASFFVYAPLVILLPFALLAILAKLWQAPPLDLSVLGAKILCALLLLWSGFLLFNAIVYPLSQNDALEYAMVGRLLFETGSLSSYPAISPELSTDGFYGPWTHPPLYVSMIALSNFIQGHADSPGLMRLIAPWFLLSATYATYALGSLINTRVAGFGAIILISTPLMFLGADSALIDALTVASLTMLLCVLTGLDFSRKSAAVVLGIVIGLGMWTHSQAILFLPVGLFLMILLTGVKNPRAWGPGVGFVILAALLISAVPYLRNLTTLGALISDEPAVFAFAPLDWRGYFDIARGLDHPVAILQYGLFKGWFSIEAYGPSYWFMTFGFVTLIFGFNRLRLRALIHPKDLGADPRTTLLYVATGLFLCYFFGTLASILLGMNLMIKNERYLLTTLPAVVLIGGYGLDRLTTFLTPRVENRRRPASRIYVFALLIGVLTFATIQIGVIGFYYRFRLLPPVTTETGSVRDGEITFMGRSFNSKTPYKKLPALEAIEYINATLPADALVLAARPADMYYAKFKMLSYLDKRLLPFYALKDPKEGAKMLADIGVTHIQMVDYYLPTSYNSVLKEIVADPALSQLDYDNRGFQVYALKPSPLVQSTVQDFGPQTTLWAANLRFILGGRKALADFNSEVALLPIPGISEKIFAAFHRDYSTSVMPVSALEGTSAELEPLLFDVTPENEYRVEFNLQGLGFVKVWVEEYKLVKGVPTRLPKPSANRIYETVLSESWPKQTLLRRFKPSPETSLVTFQIEHLGKSKVEILDASLTELQYP